jgi:hypothetical protein
VRRTNIVARKVDFTDKVLSNRQMVVSEERILLASDLQHELVVLLKRQIKGALLNLRTLNLVNIRVRGKRRVPFRV